MITAVMDWKAELFGQSQLDKSMPGEMHLLHQKEASGHTVTQRETRTEKSRHIRFDPDSQHLARKSSSAANTTDNTDSLKRSIDRSSQKRYARGLLKSKSVEFSFNSSSTDGSVLDYEKVLSRMPQDGLLELPVSREKANLRKSRRVERASRPLTVFTDVPKAIVKSKSDLLHSTEHLNNIDRFSLGDPDNATLKTSKEKIENMLETFGDAESGLEIPPTGNEFDYDVYKGSASALRNTYESNNIDAESFENKPTERFIPLTYNPHNEIDPSHFSGDTESGIDQDPYDDVVKEIKHISLSNVSNAEKLKMVCSLLAIENLEEPNLPKMSVSTIDLSSKHNVETTEDTSFTGAVATVQQMKRNLAKSMEDLNHLIEPTPNDKPQLNNSKHKYGGDKSASAKIAKSKSQAIIESRSNALSDDASPHLENVASKYTKKSNQNRNLSSNIFSRRNFISPSFLRPATSMNDLSYLGHHPLTIELLTEIERDAEHQTLKALEELDSSLKVKNHTSGHRVFTKNSDFEKKTNVEDDDIVNLNRNNKIPIVPQTHHPQIERPKETRNDQMDVLDYSSSDIPRNRTETQVPQPETAQALQRFADQHIADSDSLCSESTGSKGFQVIDVQGIDLDRLASEAEQESVDQEAVAQTLNNAEKLIEAEETQVKDVLRLGGPGSSADVDI